MNLTVRVGLTVDFFRSIFGGNSEKTGAILAAD
jgi:hypothetical protein